MPLVEALSTLQPERCRHEGATVEVVGLPGSGKTTLVREVAGAGQGIVTTSFAGRGHKVIAYARSAITLSPILLLGSAGRSSSLRVYRRMVRLEAMPANGEHGRRRIAETRVLDQGPVFLLYRLDPAVDAAHGNPAIGSWGDLMLGRWARALDLVIVLDAPDEVLLERVRVRSKRHPLDDVPPEAGRLALQRHRERLERILRDLRGRAGFDVLRINTALGRVESTAARALDAIDRATRAG